MSISENIKTMVNALSLGNVSKYEFLTGEDVLPKKDLLEKAASIKRFEYSPLCKELEKQTSIAEKHHQKFESNKSKEGKIKEKVLLSQI